ncbi:MAG: arsenic efflux protein [Oscillospiraceae bacterium]|nr:arsenic efflux protein [Oscillospiraceae bacterium]
MDLIKDVFLDALIDTAKMLPFLFGAYLLIEFLEHKASDRLANSLRKMGPFGPIGGAIIGCVPQCGFSVAVTNLFSGRLVSLGTLIAVYIATSDEAIPILLSGGNAADVGKLILAKLIIAVLAGLLVDTILRFFHRKGNEEEEPFSDLCEGCGCEEHGVVYSALKHTIQIFIFLFITSLVLGFAIELLGEDRLGSILMTDSIFQPFLAALIGLIPNCAASVLLTNLYAAGSLSFGSVVAGLSTGAGLGIVVLFKTNKRLKENIAILLLLYAIGALSGLIINLVM